jgi:hypothetical protein
MLQEYAETLYLPAAGVPVTKPSRTKPPLVTEAS